MRQKARQAFLRPWVSAREPMKEPEMAPERKPVVKRGGTEEGERRWVEV